MISEADVRALVTEGRFDEAAVLLDSFVDAPSGTDPVLSGRLTGWKGVVALYQRDYAGARRTLEQARWALAAAGDRTGLAVVLQNLGLAIQALGDEVAARELFDNALASFRACGDQRGIAEALHSLAGLLYTTDYERARDAWEEAYALFAALGDEHGQAAVSHNLAIATQDRGDLTRAESLYSRSAGLWRTHRYFHGLTESLQGLAEIAHAREEFTAAAALHGEAVALLMEIEEWPGVAESLEGVAFARAGLGQIQECARLLGAATELRDRLDCPPPADHLEKHEHDVAAIRRRIATAEWDRASNGGRLMPIGDAVREAAADGGAPAPRRTVSINTARLDAEVIVIGAGIMGTAAARALARRGHDVLVLEASDELGARGSSRGATRIFRLTYADPDYVALALESLGAWRELERTSSEPLLAQTGTLEIGAAAAELRQALARHHRALVPIDAFEALDRFGVHLPPGSDAHYQCDGAVIAGERAVQAQAADAARAGARFSHGQGVTALDRQAAHRAVAVETTAGRYRASVAVVAAGPWLHTVSDPICRELPLRVDQHRVLYLQPANAKVPVVIDWGTPSHSLIPACHGAPGLRTGIRLDPDANTDVAPAAADAAVAERLAWVEAITGAAPAIVAQNICLSTEAPGQDFIIKSEGRLIVMSPCSSHGFKFAPRLGEAAADLVEGRQPGVPPGLARRWTAVPLGARHEVVS